MTVDEQFKKLLYSIGKFKEDYANGNKRAALGDMDYIRDHAIAITYLLLAEIEEENNK